MRIQFISHYSHLYGANKMLLTLLIYFHNHGYDISVLFPSKGRMTEKLDELNIPYKVIPYYSSFLYIKRTIKFIAYPLLMLLDFITFPFILLHIKNFNPDIIYSNTSAENLGYFVAKILKKKHITHVHEFMSRNHGVSFIGGNEFKRKFINKSTGAIFVTKSVAKDVMNNDFNSKKHIIIYNGLQCPIVNISTERKSRPYHYGIVGILSAGKRQDVAIKYFKKVVEMYPSSILHIYGDKEGSYKRYLFHLVKKLGLESNIIFHGFVQDIETIYKEIDILLVFSKLEGFGLVTAEAMYRGIPVIGYDDAGTSELIEDNQSGYLFTDEESFQERIKLLHCISNYERIKENAYQRAISLFKENDYCSSIETFVRKIYNE